MTLRVGALKLANETFERIYSGLHDLRFAARHHGLGVDVGLGDLPLRSPVIIKK